MAEFQKTEGHIAEFQLVECDMIDFLNCNVKIYLNSSRQVFIKGRELIYLWITGS